MSKNTDTDTENNNGISDRSDLVAYWSVPLIDGTHTIEFEHGDITGKRIVRVDGKEIIRREWMFRLVGEEVFEIGNTAGNDQHRVRCELRVDPLPHFTFGYSLLVDGKPFEQFTARQSRAMRSWSVLENGKRYRIVLEKETLNVWINGQRVDTEDEFGDEGVEMHFALTDSDKGTDSDQNPIFKGVIRANSVDKNGVVHQLYVHNDLIADDFV